MKMTHQLFWGILLILGGLLALMQTLGYADQFAPQVWIGVFVIISLLAFVGYVQSGLNEWGWLFPTGIFGGLAITLAIALTGVNKAFIATPLFIGLVIPFAAAYSLDRSRNWWALIPGGIMLFLALTTLVVDSAGGAWVGVFALLMIAVSFLAVYLNNQSRIWALIVAYVFAVISIAPLMSTVGRNANYFGAILLLAIALPFFVVYLRSATRWWAIIPAGVLTTVALIVTLAISGFIRSQTEGGYVNALMMGGLAATFAVIGWRHAKTWAKIVTIVLAVLAVASFIFANNYLVAGPVAIILLGGYLLFTALRPKKV
jgi:hypothetical protein